AEGISVDTRPADRSSTVLSFKPVALENGAALLAHGRVDSGGVAVGLLKGDRWYRRVEITEPGAFMAVVEVPQAGVYVPAIANDAPKNRWPNRFVIFRFGVAHGDAP